VEPSQKINLHFHGDFHAITAAHNLLSALVDSHIFFGNELDLDPGGVTWPRALDVNDRACAALKSPSSEGQGPGRGSESRDRFVITAASEIMAILGLASSRADLRRRLSAIVVGVSALAARDRRAIGSRGSMMALLNDALQPNLVQTTEGTPALVHTGLSPTSRTAPVPCCRSRWRCGWPTTW